MQNELPAIVNLVSQNIYLTFSKHFLVKNLDWVINLRVKFLDEDIFVVFASALKTHINYINSISFHSYFIRINPIISKNTIIYTLNIGISTLLKP